MEYNGQLSPDLLVYRIHALIVNGKGLIVRVDLNSVKFVLLDKSHLIHQAIHVSVNCAKTVESGLLCCLTNDKLVNMPGSFRFGSHRQNRKFSNAGQITPFN